MSDEFDNQLDNLKDLARFNQGNRTNAILRNMQEGVGPCPHCGGGLASIGISVCRNCGRDLVWSGNFVGKPGQESLVRQLNTEAVRAAGEAAERD